MISRILVCAATSVEVDACARGIGSSDRFELLSVGVGGSRAGEALRSRLAKGERPKRVVSSGFAGALRDDVDLGAWITAARLYQWTNSHDATEIAGAEPIAQSKMLPCAVVSVDDLAGPDSPVRAFRSDAPAIVDMESAAIAREACAYGIPFSVARVVSDTPRQPLPHFLAAFTTGMAAERTGSRISAFARGAAGAIVDPRGVARLAREGKRWTTSLTDMWRELRASFV